MSFRQSAVTALALLAPPAAADVWVVGPPGPGVDAPDIQQALALSAPGDTILVRFGFYPAVVIEEGVSIVADTFASVLGVTVRNLPADQALRLQGLELGFAPAGSGPALDLHDNLGPVLVEDCLVTAFSMVGPRTGVRVNDCAAVIVSNSELNGGDGLSIFDDEIDFVVTPGGDALRVTGSSFVALLGSVVRGGGGGNDSEGSGFSGGAAGHGLVASAGLVHASGTRLQGGHGGWDQFAIGGQSGDGGIGLLIDGPATVRLHDSETVGGEAGAHSPTGTSGVDGAAQSVCCGGSIVPLAGLARGVTCESPKRETETVELLMSGVAGETALLFVSADVGALDAPAFDGVLVAAPILLTLGATLDGAGGATLAGAAPHLPAGVEGVEVVLQGLFASGGATLSSVATLTLLAAGL